MMRPKTFRIFDYIFQVFGCVICYFKDNFVECSCYFNVWEHIQKEGTIISSGHLYS